MTSLQLAKEAAKILDEKKALKINVIRIDNISTLADYFVIAHGNGSVHVRSLTDELAEKLEQEGVPQPRVEGHRGGSWILLDYGSVVVHIFTPEARKFYDLDRLWADGVKIDFEEE